MYATENHIAKCDARYKKTNVTFFSFLGRNDICSGEKMCECHHLRCSYKYCSAETCLVHETVLTPVSLSLYPTHTLRHVHKNTTNYSLNFC